MLVLFSTEHSFLCETPGFLAHYLGPTQTLLLRKVFSIFHVCRDFSHHGTSLISRIIPYYTRINSVVWHTFVEFCLSDSLIYFDGHSMRILRNAQLYYFCGLFYVSVRSCWELPLFQFSYILPDCRSSCFYHCLGQVLY